MSPSLTGNRLPRAAKTYTLTLKPPMTYAKPVPPGFWSVTMYDKATSYTVPNPINRDHLADYDKLTKNADGSITRNRTGSRPPRELSTS